MRVQLHVIILFLIAISAFPGCKTEIQVEEIPNPNYAFGTIKWKDEWIEKDTAGLTYPCTIDSVIFTFFNTWGDSTTYEFKSMPDSLLSSVNHGTGMWLRNTYGLWGRTCLVEYFWELGIIHPDDISAILLTTYHRFLNGKALEVDKQVEMYKAFWKNEMDLEYKLEDSLEWEFPPSMWDFGITEYIYLEEE